MKKTISLIITILMITMLLFTVKSYAVSLDTVKFDVDKTVVRPGEEVKATLDFGKQLGAYTVEVNYDNNIFEYVSVDGGTANDTKDKVKVTFHDSTGGTSPRESMSVTFKAKEGITTSNPTELTVTAEGLSNSDASETYDDITTPLVKNLTVEPEYKDYQITLEHSGDIEKDVEKEMKLTYFSSMGRYYEHARLIAEATTPKDASVKLLATDGVTKAETDIIQSGWGDPQGYKIGGKDVSQTLNVRALFSEVGDYSITLKLIDRDNSDTVIAQKTFEYKVAEKEVTPPEEEKPSQPEITPPAEETEQPTEKPDQTTTETKPNETVKQETPNKLPKTGYNEYVIMSVVLFSVIGLGIYINKKK
mgnify:FL=1